MAKRLLVRSVIILLVLGVFLGVNACASEGASGREWGARFPASPRADHESAPDEWATFDDGASFGISGLRNGDVVSTLSVSARGDALVVDVVAGTERHELTLDAADPDELALAGEADAFATMTGAFLADVMNGGAASRADDVTSRDGSDELSQEAERTSPFGRLGEGPFLCDLRAKGATAAAVVVALGAMAIVNWRALRSLPRGEAEIVHAVSGFALVAGSLILRRQSSIERFSIRELIEIVRARHAYASAAFGPAGSRYCSDPVSLQVRRSDAGLELRASRAIDEDFFETFPAVVVSVGNFEGDCWGNAYGGACIDRAFATQQSITLDRRTLGPGFLRGEWFRLPSLPDVGSTGMTAPPRGLEHLGATTATAARPAIAVRHPFARPYFGRIHEIGTAPRVDEF